MRELEQSRADLGPVVSERGLPGEKDSSAPSVDSLELLLAAAGPPMRPLPIEGSLLDQPGKPMTPGSSMDPALVEQLVRRLIIGGDRRRGVARLDLDGDYAGTTVWVRGEGSVVELEVVLGPGRSTDGLPERLLGRLRARGLDVTSLEVR